ncbi:MAG: glycosyltransferase [Fusobacteria bacterium]|nr:MAG: glycosyltransferase [Fusobacteriota bacterium]KAF0229262.1 MAG: hypothetical protein FD182_1518 [Fusobacteriota bacterium]
MNILIVVVIYNKRINEIKYIEEIKSADILIYDNSKNSQNKPDGAYYYHNENNGGVSMAYNYGINLAIKLQKDFIILLDQDTSFDEEILDKYYGYAKEFGKSYIYAPIVKNGVRIYSPYIEGMFKNYPQNTNDFNYDKIYNIEEKSLINSGMMIPLDIISDIGPFKEDIKLDFSDTYFVEKYKKQFKEVILMDVFLEHKLSGDEGKNKQKELSRFKYYCNGAKVYKNTTNNIKRVNRLVFFRMLRLITKYKTLIPISIFKDYFLGDLRI